MKLLARLTLGTAAVLGFTAVAEAQDAAATGAGTNPARGAMLEKFVEKFKAADADGNGTLSKPEMEKGFPRLAPHFDEIDTNHDGGVTMAEIGAYMKTLKSSQ